MSTATTVAYHCLRPDVEDAPAVSLPAALAAIDLDRGRPVNGLPGGLTALSFDGRIAPGPPHWLGQRVPLVSELFTRTLVSAGVDNFQTFPVRLLAQPGGAEHPGYTAFNVIGCVDAADREASVGELLIDDDPGPRLVAYSKLVLASSRTRDLDLFRLADSPTTLVAHDRVVRELLAHAPAQGWGLSIIEIEVR
jgi:hypothetical protein